MVLNFEKRIFESLNTPENKDELKKLIYLISHNFTASMFCDTCIQNFIFLDIDTCEYLLKISDDSSIQKYYDKFYAIESRVTNIKEDIIKIVYEVIEPGINQVKYEYSLVKDLISKNSKIILENISDRHIYGPMLNSCKDPRVKLDIDFLPGNGAQIPDFIESRKEKKEINLVITDMDKKYPDERNKSSTPYIVRKKILNLNLPYRHIIINFKNVEGLIPLKKMKEKSLKNFDFFDEYYGKNDEWIIYFDFKKGIQKNLYSRKKNSTTTITDSLKWWIKVLDDSQLENKVSSMSDSEMFKTGLGLDISTLDLTEEDFKNNSSEMQKEEYNRIYSLVYPYVMVNDYGVI